jgi:hypothetical protein
MSFLYFSSCVLAARLRRDGDGCHGAAYAPAENEFSLRVSLRLCGSASRQQNLSWQTLHLCEILANDSVVWPQLYCGLETDN